MLILIIIVFIISFIINVVLLFAIRAIIRKNEFYKNWFVRLYDEIYFIIHKFDEVDYKGSFRVDDEVGEIYKSIKKIIYSLNVFIEQPKKEED